MRGSLAAVDRETLKAMLAEERSLAEIGQALGRHPSTVAYWVRKHGLEAANRDRHLPRSGLPADALRAMVDDGATQREMAAEFGVSQATVKHWLMKLGLRSRNGPGRRRIHPPAQPGVDTVRSFCSRHGMRGSAATGAARIAVPDASRTPSRLAGARSRRSW